MAMDLAEYKKHLAQLPYGKRLHTALYLYHDHDHEPGTKTTFGQTIDSLLANIIERYQITPDFNFNVIKFRTDELKVSFLSYPDFISDPHPALRHAITVDLVTGKARHSDYSSNLNPPILHRKEAFLPPDHPSRPAFAALTDAEEAAGLYANTSTIGFKLNWERLLQSKGLANFDYGCGQGSDVRGLQALGHQAEGWDPVFRRDTAKQESDIVNLGYVLNVIEDPAERVESLVDAYRHTKRLLVVSAMISEKSDNAVGTRSTASQTFHNNGDALERIPTQLNDGVLTKRNTFQKYFEQQELQQYIEDALDTTAVPVALGVFYVFRDPADQQDFLSARSRRAMDWTQISARLGLGAPRTLWKALFEKNKELLEAYWSLTLQLGRMPEPEEFPRFAELREKVGSGKRALRLFVLKGGGEEIQKAAEARKRDLLVYVALANLRKRVPFGHLSQTLRWDIRTFFGNYTRAQEKGLELLYAALPPTPFCLTRLTL